MKIRERWEKSGEKQKLGRKLAIGGVLAAVVGGGIVWWNFYGGEEQSADPAGKGWENVSAPGADSGSGAGRIQASGVTSAGVNSQNFELSELDTELVIAEVYVEGEEEVEAGAPILRLTEESVSQARRELEKAAREAELDYRELTAESEEERLTAQKEYDLSLAEAEYADFTYTNGLKEYQDEIDDLQEQIEEKEALVEEYQASIESNYYYTYYEVAEKQQILNENFSALMDIYESWDVAWLEDNFQSADFSSGGGSTQSESASGADTADTDTAEAAGGPETGGRGASIGGGKGGVDNNSTKLTAYELFDEEVQENQAEYEEAVELYEKAKRTAETSLAEEQSNLELLKLELEDAQIAYEKKEVELQAEKEAALSGGSTAESVYELAISRIEDALELAGNEKEEAEENLRAFEETVGDGYLYAEESGSIVGIMVEEGRTLAPGSVVIAYRNPDSMTIQASVDQSEIASLTVGGGADIEIEGYGSLEGKIQSIDPVSESGQKGTVSYTVTVELEGDVSGLEENLTAVVSFETGETETEMQTAETETQAAETETQAAEEETQAAEEETQAAEEETQAAEEEAQTAETETQAKEEIPHE